ncbi:transglycosylase family protein [Streptomyces sp. RS10V-4]|uniref:LysM peptidoglycan-binding domain-containing protein n=1 Tax=Streptomyces rhizoryzae TaxID=2932493 RepID=UPI002004C262|nr:transglycosylase family protein [Streptomyces rhizoryzae]MCK7625087.1 transglycosylase family protein [Streptomyces rhizoryzae]
MTGAGLALPLLTASGAHAADAATWDRVAQCESGGVWSSAGNGFYGGLRLTQEMWDDYGGSAYAARPDLASRAQQIAVAQAILDHRGPDAFHGCAVTAGLTGDRRAPGVDPGSTPRPTPPPSDGGTGTGSGGSGPSGGPSGTAGTPGGTGRSGGAADDGGAGGQDTADPATPAPGASTPGGDAAGPPPATPAPADSPSPSAPAPSAPGSPAGDPSGPAAPDPSGSAAPGGPGDTGTPPAAGGRHRGAPDGGADAGEDRDAGRHASRGGEAPRTPPEDSGRYRVRPGDNLSAIAGAHDLPGGWPALYHRNQDVIGADADLIQPGQLLDLGRTQR